MESRLLLGGLRNESKNFMLTMSWKLLYCLQAFNGKLTYSHDSYWTNLGMEAGGGVGRRSC